MKKILFPIVISTAIVFGMTACNNNQPADQENNNTECTEMQEQQCEKPACTCDSICMGQNCEACADSTCTAKACCTADKKECCKDGEAKACCKDGEKKECCKDGKKECKKDGKECPKKAAEAK